MSSEKDASASLSDAEKECLYSRGFLVTNCAVEETPLKKWNHYEISGYHFYVHPKQYLHHSGNFVMIGHAYDPFTMQYREEEILRDFSVQRLNELTGIFTVFEVLEDGIRAYGDATCMQSTFYGLINGNCYFSTHANLIGEILHLEWDPYIKELVGYRHFHLFGTQLPGNLSEYREIKRLVPNHYVEVRNGKISETRFHTPHTYEFSNEEIRDKASELLHNNLDLISQKWERPAISLTGGCDSKTTLSCANGLYDRFAYFSYISTDEEQVDAEAAGQICQKLGLPHQIYFIPHNDSEIGNIESVRKILYRDCGEMRRNNPNDIRKRAWFAERDLFDIEVKSWASEIGRAYYSKRFFGRKNFGAKPTPRKCSTMYKVFLNDRKLLKKTDAVFREYLNQFFRQADKNPLPWQEQFFWEFRVAAWNALVITHEHRYSFDITIPYNNRILLEYLLSAPLKDRIDDTIYKMIRQKMNQNIDATNISVQNVKHTQKRALAENLYYSINTHLPF